MVIGSGRRCKPSREPPGLPRFTHPPALAVRVKPPGLVVPMKPATLLFARGVVMGLWQKTFAAVAGVALAAGAGAAEPVVPASLEAEGFRGAVFATPGKEDWSGW